MRIATFALTQFRSHADRVFDFSGHDLHLLIGPNGSGKTNVLEAIVVLSRAASCLGNEEEDLRAWGTQFYRVRAELLSDMCDPQSLEIVAQWEPKKQKACFINDVRVPVATFVGALPTVLFLPQDLQLFTGAPALRRRFLDCVLTQVSPEYYRALASYQKVLKQRGSLLKNIAEGTARAGELAVWDAALAEHGSVLTVFRLELMETFGLTLREEMESLGERTKSAEFQYERSSQERDRGAIAKELQELLIHYRERDILLRATTVGPHRDDWHIVLDSRALRTFASRGQQRTAVLALLFLQVSYLGLRRGEKPVILLDDVFSELDDRHQQGVLTSFTEHQVIITATHMPNDISHANVWDIERAAALTRSSSASP